MESNKIMPTSKAISRRATGIWRLRGTDQDQNVEKESLAIKQSTSASDPTLNYDHVDGSFEFGGIRVRLVIYKSIPGVIQINASKTISEWNTLRTLKHINIVGFDDSNPSISHWLPTNANDHEDDPKGRCELYISKPPVSVTVAAAAAQYPCDFTTEHVLVTGEGFKLANIHLCEAVKANTNVRDLRSIGQILRDVLIGKSRVPENVEWLDFYIVMMEEIAFNAYRDILPRLLFEHWLKSSGEYETTSQDDRLRGIAYLVS
ncbi:uncharacterized protein PAC_18359 [Phialocephala subalpina]|uniref:Protein kinase domain-containing protein n=1 Tax=Phialocephala subalpina TaxID=576137 RepID=A0A1L7XTW5_9HELO|nr:uncharacterized protein PAC_18359 [Phialocephala subalpina]